MQMGQIQRDLFFHSPRNSQVRVVPLLLIQIIVSKRNKRLAKFSVIIMAMDQCVATLRAQHQLGRAVWAHFV